MAETLTCPACRAELRWVDTSGPAAERYEAIAHARCPRVGCGQELVVEAEPAGVRSRVVAAWRAERRWARWRGALGVLPRAVAGLWCVPAPYVGERLIIVAILQAEAHLCLRAIAARAAYRPLPGFLGDLAARSGAVHGGLVALPFALSLLVGLLVATARVVGDGLLVGRIARGEHRRAELCVVRSGYR